MILHLFNGDSTRIQFEQTNLSGDQAVWREIMCEGLAVADLESDAFWRLRSQFLRSFSKISYDKHFQRQKKLVLETDLKPYDEIVLWFEYDLFCQINMLAVLSWLNRKKTHFSANIFLICLGEHPRYDRLVGLGEIEPGEYAELFQSRTLLENTDLEYASDLWALYCSNDHRALISRVEAHRKFPYLYPALQCHQRRFPGSENGLNELEQQILELVKQGVSEKRKIIGTLLRQENYYGFGDLQYFKILDGLAVLFREEGECVYLNDLGNAVIQSKVGFMELRTSLPQYGGASIKDFRWESKTSKLVEV